MLPMAVCRLPVATPAAILHHVLVVLRAGGAISRVSPTGAVRIQILATATASGAAALHHVLVVLRAGGAISRVAPAGAVLVQVCAAAGRRRRGRWRRRRPYRECPRRREQAIWI